MLHGTDGVAQYVTPITRVTLVTFLFLNIINLIYYNKFINKIYSGLSVIIEYYI